MINEQQRSKAIQMSLQTAEVHISGVESLEELHLSFSLMSIARGNCNIQVKPANENRFGFLGRLKISIDRPIMNGVIFLQNCVFSFDDVIRSNLACTVNA